MSSESPCLLDIHIHMCNRVVFSTKHLIEDRNEALPTTIRSALIEYAFSNLDDEPTEETKEEEDDGNDPVKLAVRGMMARMLSIKYAGVTTMNLIKYAEMSSHIPTTMLDSKSCPLLSNGMIIQLSAEKETPSPLSKEAKKHITLCARCHKKEGQTNICQVSDMGGQHLS